MNSPWRWRAQYPAAPGLADKDSLAHILLGLLSGLKNQTRFDCQDIHLADSGDIYSRFLVAPRRPGKKGRLDIAAGGRMDSGPPGRSVAASAGGNVRRFLWMAGDVVKARRRSL
ncbi:hypothetical protein HCH_01505 [Hahella chejuensis KCTC 2396]|uniref:Uncharacterized protein n=1 Tax=Hahella chejuensis (strain KCTC 2396) TaxID=349521 RepID=Q2SLW1_HAHCH|nr:hypothetical protein HCH_01505 [Hahella chejuensis KCTC 2396]